MNLDATLQVRVSLRRDIAWKFSKSIRSFMLGGLQPLSWDVNAVLVCSFYGMKYLFIRWPVVTQ